MTRGRDNMEFQKRRRLLTARYHTRLPEMIRRTVIQLIITHDATVCLSELTKYVSNDWPVHFFGKILNRIIHHASG